MDNPRRTEQLRSFLDLCERADFAPEPFQKQIAGAFFDREPELLVLLPRGQGKSRLIGALAVHHLLTEPEPRIYVCAASREQAGVVHEYAKAFAREVDPDIVVNQREIRTDTGYLRVVASDAGKLQGLTPSLAVVDELHAHKDADVYLAMRTSLLKRPGAKLAVISTAGHGAESPLGRLRARALAGDVKQSRLPVIAVNDTIRMLEWSAQDDADVEDLDVAKKVNPASWVTRKALREQREALPEIAWRRFHLNQWAGRIGSWLPAGSWQACANGKTPMPEGSRIWIGADIGGARADTALVWLDEEFRVGCWIQGGADALMEVPSVLLELASKYRIVEFTYDPWRAQTLAQIAEQHRIKTTAFPQSDSRMIPASAALHQAIVEKRIHHPDDPKLNEHVAAAVARHGRRGWRVDQAERGANIDGLIALCMAFEARTAPAPPPTKVYWQ